LLIGLESPTGEALDGIELKSNWKARQASAYGEAIRRIQAHGIAVIACFVLGLDTQGPEVFDEVLAFVRESGVYDVQITLQTPFLGTPLRARLLAEGRLVDPDNWNRYTLFDLNFTPRKMTADELRRGFRRLAEQIYSREETARRRRAFRQHLHHKRRPGLANGKISAARRPAPAHITNRGKS
jgi:radical SAM superfamily enzyme